MAVLFSCRQCPQKIVVIHAMLECLPAINKNHRNLVGVSLLQFGVSVDVHLAPLEVGFALSSSERLFHDVAEMTSLPRIHYYIVHVTIVKVTIRRPYRQADLCGSYGAPA